jgi:hypothetical protein
VFHEPRQQGNSSRKQDPAVDYFYSAAAHRLRGALWPSFAPARIGYSYTSHGYARDYGFGNNVSTGIGQVSAGILISGVAKIAVSRAFGPSQTYVDSRSMAKTTMNNFKSWSFGITYQSAPPTK